MYSQNWLYYAVHVSAKAQSYNPMSANAWTIMDIKMHLDMSESRRALAHMDISQRFALDV